jgi:hypothetical protein
LVITLSARKGCVRRGKSKDAPSLFHGIVDHRPSRLPHRPLPSFSLKLTHFSSRAMSWALVPGVSIAACLRVSARFPFRAHPSFFALSLFATQTSTLGTYSIGGIDAWGCCSASPGLRVPLGRVWRFAETVFFAPFEIYLLSFCSFRVNLPPAACASRLAIPFSLALPSALPSIFDFCLAVILPTRADHPFLRKSINGVPVPPVIPQRDAPLRSEAHTAVLRANVPGRGRTARGGGGF